MNSGKRTGPYNNCDQAENVTRRALHSNAILIAVVPMGNGAGGNFSFPSRPLPCQLIKEFQPLSMPVVPAVSRVSDVCLRLFPCNSSSTGEIHEPNSNDISDMCVNVDSSVIMDWWDSKSIPVRLW